MQGFVYSDLQEIDSGKMIIMVQQYCKIGVSLIGDQCEHNIVYSKCRSLLSHGMQNTFNGTVKPSLSGDIFGRKGGGGASFQWSNCTKYGLGPLYLILFDYVFLMQHNVAQDRPVHRLRHELQQQKITQKTPTNAQRGATSE